MDLHPQAENKPRLSRSSSARKWGTMKEKFRPTLSRTMSLKPRLGFLVPSLVPLKSFAALKMKRLTSAPPSLRVSRSQAGPETASPSPVTSDLNEPAAIDPLAEESKEENGERQRPKTLTDLLDEIVHLFGRERLIVAWELLLALEEKMQQTGDKDEEVVAVRNKMGTEPVKKVVDELRLKGPHCKKLLDASHTMDGWTLASNVHGTSTYFQLAEDGRSVRVRLEGELAVSPLEQCAVIREAQLFKTWIPFCRDSKLLHREGQTDMIFWMKLGVWGLFSWDLLINGFACDCTPEEGCIIISAESVESTDRVADPPKPPTGLGNGRVEIRDFSINMKLVSSNISHVSMIFLFDPKLHGPGIQDVVNFVIKKIASYFLHFLRDQAVKVLKLWDTFPLAKIIREEPFYTGFLASRLVEVCVAENWDIPDIAYKLVHPERLARIKNQLASSSSSSCSHDGERALTSTSQEVHEGPTPGEAHDTGAVMCSTEPQSLSSYVTSLLKNPTSLMADSKSVMVVVAFLLSFLSLILML